MKDNKLAGMLISVPASLYEVIEYTYPDYNIKKWELTKSTVGGMWKDESFVLDALDWAKEKLHHKYNCKNIYDVYLIKNKTIKGLVKEIRLSGLTTQKFEGSELKLFEFMYGEKLDKKVLNEKMFSFELNPIINIESLKNIGSVYVINDSYYELCDIGKTLCNDIIRYCEENNKYPLEKEIRGTNGFISITQFEKYFGSREPDKSYRKHINEVKYLEPQCKNNLAKNNPNLVIKYINNKECDVCNKLLSISKFKYGSNRCRDCSNKISSQLSKIRNYNKKYNLQISNMNDLSPIEWHDLYISQKMKQMPFHLYNKESMMAIVRHCILVKEGMSIDDIAWNKLKTSTLGKHRLKMGVNTVFGNKAEMMNYCFPEMPYKIEDDKCRNIMYSSDIGINMIIEDYIQRKEISIDDIISKQVIEVDDFDLLSLISSKDYFSSYSDIWNWYFKYNGINKRKETSINSTRTYPIGYMDIRENRINVIKNYCEDIAKTSILDVINNEDKLIEWTNLFYKSNCLKGIFSYSHHYNSLYESLTDAYPSILKNKTMFDWE